MHVTLLPEEAALHADSIFLGDAETVWAQVVEDARHRRLKPRYQGPPGVAPDRPRAPAARSVTRARATCRSRLMQYVRGCRFACRFCAVSQYFDRKHYVRAIDEVLREIEAQDRRFLFFVDDNIASDQKALAELCRALIPMKVQLGEPGQPRRDAQPQADGPAASAPATGAT